MMSKNIVIVESHSLDQVLVSLKLAEVSGQHFDHLAQEFYITLMYHMVGSNCTSKDMNFK